MFPAVYNLARCLAVALSNGLVAFLISSTRTSPSSTFRCALYIHVGLYCTIVRSSEFKVGKLGHHRFYPDRKKAPNIRRAKVHCIGD